MIIKVCVGSSCHLKGSYDVIESFKEILKKYDVEDVVELQASFCLGHCAQGVTVECNCTAAEKSDNVDSDAISLHGVSRDNAEEVFVKQVFPLLKLK